MSEYRDLYEYALNRFGSVAELEARLPSVVDDGQLRQRSDDRYLSLISLRIFRAGLRHSVVDAKWPAFEEVFFGFEPQKVVLMGGEHLERLMQDSRLIRHLGKLRSVPLNAQMVLDIARQHGRFGEWLADWPSQDVVGLWRYLARQGNQLGGLSAPRFLRMAGKDTFILTDDVVAALKAAGVVDKHPGSRQALADVQAYFNRLQSQSGWPLCQLSMLLALRVNH